MISIKIDDTAGEDVSEVTAGRKAAEEDRDDLALQLAMVIAERDALRNHMHDMLDEQLDEMCDDAACDALIAYEGDED